MSGTALDHRLVRDYLRELDAAMRGLPAAAARELREQIAAHLEDALGPEAGDQEVAVTLSRLGSPAGLAAEAGGANGSSGPRFTPGRSRIRWRLAVVIAVPTLIAAALGTLQISSDASNVVASGRVQRLAQLDAAVVRLTQDLEDERDLSAAYAARKPPGPVPATLARARTATDAAASAVRADAAGPVAAYEPAVQALSSLLSSLTDLGDIRAAVSSAAWPAPEVIRVYTGDVIAPAITFSATVGGGGISDARVQDTLTTLAALLRVQNDQSVQRAIVYAALSAQPPVLAPEELSTLQQANAQEASDLAAFGSSAGPAEQRLFANTVAGPAVDSAAAEETLAESQAAANPSAPLTRNTGLNAATWYANMSTTIRDTRQVVGQLVGQITGQANTLKSNAAKSLLLTSTAALALLLVLISAVLARPLGKQHAGMLAAVTRESAGPPASAVRADG